MAAAGNTPTELGTKKVSTLLRQYAVPGIIAMTASSLYNMVDSIYIGHIPDVGSYAISALAICSPLMNLGAALGTLVGVGASTILSILLGQNNYAVARKVLSNEVTLNVILGLLFTLVTLPFLNPILYFFGASANTLPFARDYIVIILLGNVFTHLYFGLNSMIRAAGNPRLSMNLTIFTVVSNAVLDPIFIYVLDMGIRGAAIATVLCQFTALAWTWKYFMKKDNFLHFPKGVFGLDWRVAKDSLAIGMGPFLMNSAACIVALFINQQLRKYGGDLSLGAYGIANRITFFFLMIVVGLNHGMQPIAGYNYGARKYSRVRQIYFLTASWATLVTVAGYIISEVFPGPASALFTNDPTLKDLAANCLKKMNVLFFIVGFQMVSTNFFQSLGMVGRSILLSLSRQLLFLVPLVWVLPRTFRIDGVWYSFPASDLLAATLTLILLIPLLRKFSALKDGEDTATTDNITEDITG